MNIEGSDDSLPERPMMMIPEESGVVNIKDTILYIYPPGSSSKTFGYPVKINALGFREKELKAVSDNYRILVFGDSFTFGWAIDEEHRYTNVLQKWFDYLQIKGPKGEKIEIVNFGMQGYALDQIHDLMEGVFKLMKFDAVVIGFNTNDFVMTDKPSLMNTLRNPMNGNIAVIDDAHIADFCRKVPELTPSEFYRKKTLLQKFAIYRTLELRTSLFKYDKLPTEPMWNYVYNEFSGIRELTSRHGISSLRILLLHRGFVNGDKNDFISPVGGLAQNIEIFNFTKKRLEENGFTVIDTLPFFKKYNHMSLAHSEWDAHPNFLAHYIYARSILDYTLKNGVGSGELAEFVEKNF